MFLFFYSDSAKFLVLLDFLSAKSLHSDSRHCKNYKNKTQVSKHLAIYTSRHGATLTFIWFQAMFWSPPTPMRNIWPDLLLNANFVHLLFGAGKLAYQHTFFFFWQKKLPSVAKKDTDESGGSEPKKLLDIKPKQRCGRC